MKKDLRKSSSAGRQRINGKLLLLLVVGTLLSTVLYFSVVARGNETAAKVVMIVYVAAASVTAVAYFICNRGFAVANATPEMLPDSLSYDEKEKMISDARDRKKRTRWMPGLLFIFLFPRIVDLFNLFVVELFFPGGFVNWLKSL